MNNTMINRICIGIHVHAEPERLNATLDSLNKNTNRKVKTLILLDDLNDDTAVESLASLYDLPHPEITKPAGTPASFNRLIACPDTDIFVLLESGVIVGPGWLDHILAALDSDPRNGIAGPSTNRSWNEQCVFPGSVGTPAEISRTAQEAEKRFGAAIRTLLPLYSLADFCYAVRHEVVQTVGAADEDYGSGPCWEMDYNIRAARTGFQGVWACAAYVYRAPPIALYQREETLRFEASKRRYQNKFCSLKLENKRREYCRHCNGEVCKYFARKDLIQIHLPLSEKEKHIQKTARSTISEQSGHALESMICDTELPSPLVSCIMPTYNRRPFISRAIEYFLRQDYPNRELIIVDDGTDPIKDLVPNDPRIRYLRLENRCTIGSKRNMACREAKGEIMANWDDDDWMASWRLSYQVRSILKEKADICGLNRLLFHDQKNGQSWQYIYPERDRPWIAGGTFCYTRSFWKKNPFPDISAGEDTRCLWNNNPKKIIILQNNTFYVAIIHPANTSHKRVSDSLWHSYPTREIRDIIGEDWTLYTDFKQNIKEASHGIKDNSEIHTKDLPLVSCIMPTYNRRLFIPQAINYFLRQDYPNKELVIVDDGTDKVADLILNDDRIKYIPLDHRASIGCKRNLAVKHSSGEIIAHLDDDDWYSPSYLKNSIQKLIQSREREVISGVAVYLVYILEDSILKICRTGRIAGATFCYFKSLWEKNPYRDVYSAEDYFFIEDVRSRSIFVEEPELFIVIRHKHHTWKLEKGIDINIHLRKLRNYSKQLDDIIDKNDCKFYEMAKLKFYT